MRKKILCTILVLSTIILPLGYVNPMNSVQAEEKKGLERYVGYNVINYGGIFYHPTTEDTLLFESIENPDSYTVLPKGSTLGVIGLLYYDMTNTGFIYVEYGKTLGYVDSRYIDMSTFVEPEIDPNDIITVEVTHKALGTYTAILTPYNLSIGVYLDQERIPRNALGQEVSPYTGELYVEPEVSGELYDLDLEKLHEIVGNK